MEKLLRCDCGFEVRADDEQELVAAVQSHAWTRHAMTLTREQVLVLLLRSELGEPRLRAKRSHLEGGSDD
jgi:predicted small metal-binding protein